MGTRTKKLLILTVIIATLAPAIYFYFHDGGNDPIEFIKLIFLRLGNLALIAIFIKKMSKASQNSIKKVGGILLSVFIGGGWILQLSAGILETILKSIFC